jgi:tetratricopeptide (TPR) repeat protein
MLLSTVYRRLADRSAEHKVLDDLAARDGSASPGYLRLVELDLAAEDWGGLARNAERLLAVNPLLPAPHRALAVAAEHLGKPDLAITAYRALALVDESDPAAVHYHLARLLEQSGKLEEARREVLKSLEEAPRYLEAHRLLLELAESHPGGAAPDRSP